MADRVCRLFVALLTGTDRIDPWHPDRPVWPFLQVIDDLWTSPGALPPPATWGRSTRARIGTCVETGGDKSLAGSQAIRHVRGEASARMRPTGAPARTLTVPDYRWMPTCHVLHDSGGLNRSDVLQGEL